MLELNIEAYTEYQSRLPRFFQYLLHQFRDYLDRRIDDAVLQDLARGTVICVPRQCWPDLAQRGKAMVQYVAYALGMGRQAAWLPAPRQVRDFNATELWPGLPLRGGEPGGGGAEEGAAAAQAPLQPYIKHGESVQSGCIVARVPEAARFCWHADLGPVVEELNGPANDAALLSGRHGALPGDRPGSWQAAPTAQRAPRWLFCHTAGFDGAWRAWAAALEHGWGREGSRHEPQLFRTADALIRHHAAAAWRWALSVTLHSAQFCGSSHMLADEMQRWAGDELCVYYYILGGPEEPWGKQRCWNQLAGFCPFGFVAALIVRARGLQLRNHVDQAQDDLHMASAMLGWCRELDFLYPEAWQMSSTDLDRTVLDVLAPDSVPPALQQAFGGDNLGGDGSAADISARAEHSSPDAVFIWHALQLNTLVRLRLSSAVASSSRGGTSSPPALAMLTYPSYLAILLIPALLRAWSSLRLALFYLGLWQQHEKCPACAESYRRRYLVEDPFLQGLPLDYEKNNAGVVDFDRPGASLDDVAAALRRTFAQQPRAREAEVILCTAPLWLCATLLLATTKPFLALCLLRPDVGAPPSLGAEPAKRLLEEHVVRPLSAALRARAPAVPRALWLREDMARSYSNFELYEYGFFHPFVYLPSLYIDARYQCRELADVVVMREGSLGRFATTLRGHLFFSVLAQLTPACEWRPACPWRFEVLAYTSKRLTYGSIARYRAAVFVPSVWYGKLTYKDLVTMEIPLFMADLRLQASISEAHGLWGCGQWSSEPRWALTLCRHVRLLPRLEQSSFFRYPHAMHFSSLTDLVSQLAALDCTALSEVSARMRHWNAEALEDDMEFWRVALTALATAPPAPQRAVGASDQHGEVDEQAAPQFQLPVIPQEEDWTGPLHAYCLLLPEGAERRNCHLETALTVRGPGLGPASVYDPGMVMDGVASSSPRSMSCLWNPRVCPESLLRYGNHLLQRPPPLPDRAGSRLGGAGRSI